MANNAVSAANVAANSGGAAVAPANNTGANNGAGKPPGDRPSGNNSRGNNSPPNEPPNRGVAPKKLDGLGRMDLRVTDQNGNPVKGVKARLSTKRPNGLDCDCWETTNATGRAVLPAIHVGKQLLLELDAKGFEPQKLIVNPQDMAQPYRVKMIPKGSAPAQPEESGARGGARKPAARGEMAHGLPPAAPNPAGAQGAGGGLCLDLFRFFAAYGAAELGAARADFESGRLDSARAHYENVLAVAGTDSPAGNLLAARLFRAVARTSLGDIAFKGGRFAEAAALYSQAADGARRDNRPELAWAAQRGLARSLWAQAAAAQSPAAAKQREEALQTYRAALSTVETLFTGSLRADEARTNFLSTTRDLFEEAAAAFAESALSAQGPAAPRSYRMDAHAQQQQQTRPLEGRALAYAAEAFRIVEQGRARSLLDLIGESRAEITAGLPADLVARRAGVRARQQEIADSLRGVRAGGDKTPAQPVAGLEAELEQLSVEHDAIENRIRTASPRYRALVRAQPLALPEVQQAVLDEGTALLEYSLGRERSYLFALTRAGLNLYRLPARAEVEAQAVELRRHLIPVGVRRAIAGVDVTRGIGEDPPAGGAGRGLGVGNAPRCRARSRT
ncbi:MAG: tetratricopeptide repeat protein [Acidobacteria bacterium]|nr:tetratricopeptide repeat protein [Acidobacteriota bacterium]